MDLGGVTPPIIRDRLTYGIVVSCFLPTTNIIEPLNQAFFVSTET